MNNNENKKKVINLKKTDEKIYFNVKPNVEVNSFEKRDIKLSIDVLEDKINNVVENKINNTVEIKESFAEEKLPIKSNVGDLKELKKALSELGDE